MNNKKDENCCFAKQYNTYDLTGEYGKGWTNKGEEFWFDKEDYDKIKNYCWHFNQWGHLISTEPNSNKRVFLHRRVMEPIPEGMVVDHINHLGSRQNKYDNRKSNLRIVTQRQNALNSVVHKNNKSGVSGVTFVKSYNKWVARINAEPYKRIILGYFDNFEDAVNARLKAEQKYYGDYSFKGGN